MIPNSCSKCVHRSRVKLRFRQHISDLLCGVHVFDCHGVVQFCPIEPTIQVNMVRSGDASQVRTVSLNDHCLNAFNNK